MSERWILGEFDAALKQLDSALSVPATSDVFRAGCIQYFEFCFELAWKSIREVGRESGLPECFSPKGCLKQAFASGWIRDEETWLQMLEARNRMSHTYNAREALTIYESLSGFLPELQLLSGHLRNA